MSASLTVQVEDQETRQFPMGPVFTMGRGAGNDLVINDSRASRNHAAIRLQGDKVYYIVDLGSSNGTLLNKRRVTIPIALKNGDEIQIADHKIQFSNSSTEMSAAIDSGADAMRTQVAFTSILVSILVVDIRNYTGLSEAVPPEDLSQLVGRWFQEVDLVVQRHNGSIDKFIGDAVMAFWQKAATESDVDYVAGPLRAACELVRAAETFNTHLVARYPKFNFHVGCGIHTGRAIMGNVGVDNRRDFTAVGDCVNVAFRLESLCKDLKVPIVVSDDVCNIVGNAFEFKDLGEQSLKGKTNKFRVYSLKG